MNPTTQEKGDAAASPKGNLSTSYPQDDSSMKIRKQVRQALALLGIPHKAISRTRSGHLRIKVGKVVVHTGSTPSDSRALKNLAAQVRRAGGC